MHGRRTTRHDRDTSGRRRGLAELIEVAEPAWPLVREWLSAARHPVTVLPADRARGERTLLALEVTTGSVLGAIALETGGLLVDHGWLRVLGSGGEGLSGSLLTWNGHVDEAGVQALPGGLLVAHAAIGGFFALNGGGLPGEPGAVCSLAPDTLEWESLDLAYSGFVHWALTGDLAAFYEGSRWPGWEHDAAALTGDRGIFVYPPLWMAGSPIGERSRRDVPMTELWGLQREIGAQLRNVPDGTEVELRVVD
jgi:hypothetical protein